MALATPPGQVFVQAIREAIDPSLISRDGKTVFARCSSATADRTTWPVTRAAACQAMHMCVNEAIRTADETTRLESALRSHGC